MTPRRRVRYKSNLRHIGEPQPISCRLPSSRWLPIHAIPLQSVQSRLLLNPQMCRYTRLLPRLPVFPHPRSSLCVATSEVMRLSDLSCSSRLRLSPGRCIWLRRCRTSHHNQWQQVSLRSMNLLLQSRPCRPNHLAPPNPHLNSSRFG